MRILAPPAGDVRRGNVRGHGDGKLEDDPAVGAAQRGPRSHSYHMAPALTITWQSPGGASRAATVPLARSRSTFGARYWLRCPACGARRAALYLVAAVGAWHRRGCARLGYVSQRLSQTERARYRRRQLAARLGAAGAGLDGFPTKPPAMHRRTYRRCLAAIADADARWRGALRVELARLEARHTRLTCEAQ